MGRRHEVSGINSRRTYPVRVEHRGGVPCAGKYLRRRTFHTVDLSPVGVSRFEDPMAMWTVRVGSRVGLRLKTVMFVCIYIYYFFSLAEE